MKNWSELAMRIIRNEVFFRIEGIKNLPSLNKILGYPSKLEHSRHQRIYQADREWRK